MDSIVGTLHDQAVAALNHGHPARALRLINRALAALAVDPDRDSLPGRTLEAAIWISRAFYESEVYGAARSEETLAEAMRLAVELGDPALLVRVHSQRASMAARTGRFSLASEAFLAAEQLVSYADRNDHFAILLNSGNLRMYLGELARARELLGRAADFARTESMPDEIFKAAHNFGYVEFLFGDLPRALELMYEADRLDVAVSRGVGLLDRARVLIESGLTREADDSLAAAADVFGRDRLTQDLGEAELERARCALVAGDPEAARRLAMRARDRFRRRGNDRWRRSAELVLLQGDLAAGRPGKRLIGPAQRLRAEFLRDGVRLPARTAALIAAEAYLSAGQVESARESLMDLGRADRRDPITARLHAHYVRARLDTATGHRGAASRRARLALDELATYQASFGSIDLATAAAVHGRRLAELDLSIALSSARPEAVLAAAERARAVTNRLPAVRPPHDPQAAELLAELRQTVETLRPVEQDRVAAEPLLKRRRELEAQISARGWTRAGSGSVDQVVALDRLRACLGDTAMVSFVRADDALHAVVLSGGTSRLLPLGDARVVDEQVRRVRADLDVLAQPRLPAAMRGAVTASLTRSLSGLDSALLMPLAVTGRLVVVSTGVLGQLPWGLLPSLRGVPVVVAPSATAWHAAHTRPASRHRRVVAIAGPGLARGSEEADEVGRIWRARVLTGPAATGAAFATAMAGARIAHVAAHGVHQTENPLFSSLRLADGPLFAHELDLTVRTPEHVVLSACELGLSTVRPGDEALGLTSVLLHLGTRSVVAGVARVADDLAAATMADYHSRLARKQDCAEALAGALVDASPAPFVCFGAVFHS